MTKKILVLTGSARPNSAGNSLLPLIEKAVSRHQSVELDLAKVNELDLPFYDAPTPPSMDGFTPQHESVVAWAERVAAADAVIWLMPEYNHAMTGIQKNAIDWLYSEWKGKPLGIIAYGAYGGKYTLEVAQNVMDVISPDLKAKVGFTLGKDMEFDGTPKDEAAVQEQIDAAIDSVLA